MSAINKYFYVENGIVYRMEVFAETAIGNEKQAAFVTEGPFTTSVGTPVSIVVEWQEFSTLTGGFVTDTARTDSINIFDGETAHTLTPVNGVATLTYTPESAGDKTLTIIGTLRTVSVKVLPE